MLILDITYPDLIFLIFYINILNYYMLEKLIMDNTHNFYKTQAFKDIKML